MTSIKEIVSPFDTALVVTTAISTVLIGECKKNLDINIFRYLMGSDLSQTILSGLG